ncbi:MAG TPA: hypothetical protein VKB93_26470, partial [Thermoanaerobaculia bacterium]|nr:hypothetical protein [Thermoanaerobaculia bacterium]
ASVHGGGKSLFLTSRQQREILVGAANDAEWSELTLPTRNTDVTSVVADPFALDRYYVGTLGEGVYVYEGKMTRYTPPLREKRAQLAPAGTTNN